MYLVIVESPTKARKLSGYLGKNFRVSSSVGHVRDLPKSKLGVDEETLEPEYIVSTDKKKVVAELKRLVSDADAIYLAMDPDREGEAIAWHLQYLLGKKAAKDTLFKRSVFHEITKEAVLHAIAHPGQVNQDLVDAQQARRVLDRLVGYKVSPVLWKKVRRGLSAGRVQSPALRLIVEREREIEAFKADEYWELDVLLSTATVSKATSPEIRLATDINRPQWSDTPPQDALVARVQKVDGKKYEPNQQSTVEPLVDWLPQANYQVVEVEKKQRKRSSLPPFTTSTLQQAAATRLGYTSKQTMRLAQQLYEEGLITYHRTDSVTLSQQALAMARTYISATFGQSYVPEKTRVFATKSKNAQEAHEAIRVTDVKVTQNQVSQKAAKLTERHAKLYDLIWRRFVASQMAAAVYDQSAITVEATQGKQQATLRAAGSILQFDGWMKLFHSSADTVLPPVKSGQQLHYAAMLAAQKFTQPPPRYNDASLVKELEKRGIGRPSTYASIISVIVDRGYVERIDRRFKPTVIGSTVNDFLQKQVGEIVDYDFTAEMENDLDAIAKGKKQWKKIVADFYRPFEQKLAKVTKEAERVEIPVEKTGKLCPICGQTDKGEVVVRTGKYGKFYSCSRFPDCTYTENIVQKLEDQHCPLCQKGDIIIKNTRWGKPFFGCSRYPDCDWASWKQPEKDLQISPAEWRMMQEARKKRQAARKHGRSTGKTKRKTKKK